MPILTKSLTISNLLLSKASLNGVLPILSQTLASAPCSIRTWVAIGCPACAATCNGVRFNFKVATETKQIYRYFCQLQKKQV